MLRHNQSEYMRRFVPTPRDSLEEEFQRKLTYRNSRKAMEGLHVCFDWDNCSDSSSEVKGECRQGHKLTTRPKGRLVLRRSFSPENEDCVKNEEPEAPEKCCEDLTIKELSSSQTQAPQPVVAVTDSQTQTVKTKSKKLQVELPKRSVSPIRKLANVSTNCTKGVQVSHSGKPKQVGIQVSEDKENIPYIKRSFNLRKGGIHSNDVAHPHPFVAYGSGARTLNMANHKTFNVGADGDAVYESALKAQKKHGAIERPSSAQPSRAMTPRRKAMKQIQDRLFHESAARKSSGWSSEYQRQFPLYDPKVYQQNRASAATRPHTLNPTMPAPEFRLHSSREI